jgi:type II secretory pathway component PulJ
MSKLRLTSRGHTVLAVLFAIAFFVVLGIAGRIELDGGL